jgi:hypothetical protein
LANQCLAVEGWCGGDADDGGDHMIDEFGELTIHRFKRAAYGERVFLSGDLCTRTTHDLGGILRRSRLVHLPEGGSPYSEKENQEEE